MEIDQEARARHVRKGRKVGRADEVGTIRCNRTLVSVLFQYISCCRPSLFALLNMRYCTRPLSVHVLC